MNDAPDTTDYRVIHHCIRVAPRRIAAALRDTASGDRDRAVALATYWAGYAAEVLHHHTVEDEIFFPSLVARVPLAAEHLERIDADHHRLDELMDAAERGTRRFAETAAAADADRAAEVIDELAALMDAHLDFEDADLIPLFVRHFTAAEYEALTAAAVKGLPLRQAAFTVPFIMRWAPPAEAAEMLATAPLPMRLLHRATRGRHERLTQVALGPVLGDPAAQAAVLGEVSA